MGDILDAITDLIISRYGVAVALGLLISWSGTQFVKKLSDINGPNVTLIAFGFGAASTFALWPVYNITAFFAAIAVGFSSPVAYKLLVAVLKKHKPHLAAVLSGDRRES